MYTRPGRALDAFHDNGLRQAFRPVPAPQDAPGGNPDRGRDLADGEHRAHTAVAPEPAGPGAALDELGLRATALGALVPVGVVLAAIRVTNEDLAQPLLRYAMLVVLAAAGTVLRE